MQAFISDIQLGIMTFPFIAILLSLPYAIYQYRKLGAVSIWKTLVVAAFLLYAMCAFYLVSLPMPADLSYYNPNTQTPQLDPFFLIDEIKRKTSFSLSDRTTWLPSLKHPVVYEALFNILLTMPLGAFLRYLFKCSWWQCLLIGFATTLLFETSQLTGLFGLYAHPYRLFDVDDLILNTFGAMLGFWISIPFCHLLPSMDKIDSKSIERGVRRVGVMRRLASFAIDLTVTCIAFIGLWTIFQPSLLQVAKVLEMNPSEVEGLGPFVFPMLSVLADPTTAALLFLAVAIVVFAIIPMITRGRTLGDALVRIRIVRTDGSRAAWWQYLVSCVSLWAFLLVPFVMLMIMPDEIEGVEIDAIDDVIVLFWLLWLVSIVVRAIVSATGRPFVLLSDVISGTRLEPMLSKNAAAELAGERNYEQDDAIAYDEEAHAGMHEARSLDTEDAVSQRLSEEPDKRSAKPLHYVPLVESDEVEQYLAAEDDRAKLKTNNPRAQRK